jgi:multiple sugar transport system ATP-binding protein
VPAPVVALRPRLAEHIGSEVIVGIRPEDIEDAALVPSANGASLDVRVTLAEALGAEVIAHFPLAARSAAGSASLVAALGTESPLLDAVAEGGTVLTARLGPRTKARSGEPLRISVDVERLHFFDPQSEEAI